MMYSDFHFWKIPLAVAQRLSGWGFKREKSEVAAALSKKRQWRLGPRQWNGKEEADEDLFQIKGKQALLMDWPRGMSRKGRFENDLHIVLWVFPRQFSARCKLCTAQEEQFTKCLLKELNKWTKSLPVSFVCFLVGNIFVFLIKMYISSPCIHIYIYIYTKLYTHIFTSLYKYNILTYTCFYHH